MTINLFQAPDGFAAKVATVNCFHDSIDIQTSDHGPVTLFVRKGTVDPQAIADALNGVTAPQPEQLTQDTIPWAAMNERFKFAARDEDGEVWGYTAQPSMDDSNSCWRYGGNAIRIPGVFAGYVRGTCDWRDSLQARPEGV